MSVCADCGGRSRSPLCAPCSRVATSLVGGVDARLELLGVPRLLPEVAR